MRDMGRAARRSVGVCLAALTVLGLLACEPSTTVPDGAQLVRVAATEGSVRITPPRATAGDVFLVLEEPTQGVAFVKGKATADATPGPLSDDDVDRLARGDAQGTSIEGFETTGCEASRAAAERGRLRVPGGCGNVFRVTLAPGKYAILTGDPASRPPGSTPIAVLEVVP